MLNPAVVVGVWRHRSLVATEIATGQRTSIFGEQPSGLIIFTAGGHVNMLMTEHSRRPAIGATPTDAEANYLLGSMAAFSGTYRLDGNLLIIHMDASWSEAWTGTEHKRTYAITDDVLTWKSQPLMSPTLGKKVVLEGTHIRAE